MTDIYEVPERVRAGSFNLIRDMDDYRRVYAESRNDPDAFWLQVTRDTIDWIEEPSLGLIGDYRSVKTSPIAWFADGKLNATVSCLDRHLDSQSGKTAILWEGDHPGEERALSYAELHREVCKCANALRELGVKKGERIIIYMGMVPEAAVAMLACARIGAVHSVVFGGFSAQALRDRINDCGAEVVITQDEGLRGGRTIPLKRTVDEALFGADSVKKVLVVRRTGGPVSWTEGRDVWWQHSVGTAREHCEITPMDAEDPLFILYTSGSTGKPKGLVHTTGGYITYAAWTHRLVFDLRPNDIYACVADVGWITGHTYIVYGPLANGATTLMFESTPTYPDPGRYWEMVARRNINIFYTAPTAIRALAAFGDDPVRKHDLSSLRVLGTVGEPINPDAWRWYYDVVGDGRCNIVDTWWQTETGGIAISPIACATPTKPGSATLPLPGIFPKLVDDEGKELKGPAEGRLCIEHPWPGQARTVWGDHERYVGTYFSHFDGLYFTGDGCRRDDDGYHWITGRVDDVLNVAGHRMGTAEFESALVSVEEVAEAAVVGYPHEVKGQGVYAYIVLQPGETASDQLTKNLQAACRTAIGAHAKIDKFQYVDGLPKTRSGKVMRRILRKIAEGRGKELGDVSTLADPDVVSSIRAGAV